MTLTVACVFVQGEYPYTAQYVTRLWAMVDRFMPPWREFQFVCLTDQPAELPAWMHTVPIQPLSAHGGCWSKLELFAPARGWTGRVLYLDLDSLIVSDLSPIIDFPAPFAITADPARLHRNLKSLDRFGRAIIRHYNSSVMVWDGGAATELYADWSPSVADRLSGDQDWIAERFPEAATMDRAWFPRISEVRPPFPEATKVILVKHPKNHIVAAQSEWFRQAWGAA